MFALDPFFLSRYTSGMLRKLWIELRSSLWFVPGMLVLFGIASALILIQWDLHVWEQSEARDNRYSFFGSGAEGARGVLGTIAGSMITVAGVAFSITIVTLSLASTQYTPRILRNFMRDRANQTVLGVFLGVFVYCLVVLRTVRGVDASGMEFVPQFAVFGALVLALVSIGFLIFFIHHTAASIQASYILNAITCETLKAIDHLFPDPCEADDPESPPFLAPKEWHSIPSLRSGYLQSLDTGAIMELAREEAISLKLEHSVGDFVVEGTAIALASHTGRNDHIRTLLNAMVLGDFQTVEQDVRFGIRQIVDIALKALSPGVNDTSTAVSALNYLSVIGHRLAQRKFRSLLDSGIESRVILPIPTFQDFLGRIFDEIRMCGGGNVTILIQMLHCLTMIASGTRCRTRTESLTMQATLIQRTADLQVGFRYDRERINAAIIELRTSLDLSSDGLPDLSAERCV